MDQPVFPLDKPVEPGVTALSEGPANILEGAWPDRSYKRVSRLELHTFRVPEPRAMALVYAGGGYVQLVHDKEGIETALWLNSLGLDAHVVVHRLPGAAAPDGGVFPKDIALRDGLACLDHLASQDLGLPLFHVGLSSGGHLAGVMACQDHALCARGAIIAYAPINANHRDHKAPAGKPDYPPAEKQDFYNDWPVGIAALPHGMPEIPVFLAYALHDQAVPVDHVLNMVKSAQALGRDVDAHIFGQAPHGFALRDTGGTHALWPDLAKDWIARQLAVAA